MMTRAKVFSETYEGYLAEIRQVDYLARADFLGLTVGESTIVVPLFNDTYIFNGVEFVASNGEGMSPAVQVMLCKYILTCLEGGVPADQSGPQWITYREFKGSSPLHSYFTNNTNKTLETAFSGNLDGFRQRALDLGGELLDSAGYELSVQFLSCTDQMLQAIWILNVLP